MLLFCHLQMAKLNPFRYFKTSCLLHASDVYGDLQRLLGRKSGGYENS